MTPSLLFIGLAIISNNGASDQHNKIKAMSTEEVKPFYRIGTPGQPWSDEERAEWKSQTTIQRSYQEQVLNKVELLKERFTVEKYGDLPGYPLLAVKSTDWKAEKPCVLVTGGVHGYETSGVQGALKFLDLKAETYSKDFNILVAPCVSPWAYEHIQRWNSDLKDPNRSFKEDATTTESQFLMDYLQKQRVEQGWICHIDLHETTDTDEEEFMPARAAESGKIYEPEPIPDGFYLVADSLKSQLEFQIAIRESVRKVTHIAPPDAEGLIIGEPIADEGIICVPAQELGLCMSVVGAKYASTTEVYPDSPQCTDEICNDAQVASITGALDYLLNQ